MFLFLHESFLLHLGSIIEGLCYLAGSVWKIILFSFYLHHLSIFFVLFLNDNFFILLGTLLHNWRLWVKVILNLFLLLFMVGKKFIHLFLEIREEAIHWNWSHFITHFFIFYFFISFSYLLKLFLSLRLRIVFWMIFYGLLPVCTLDLLHCGISF